VSGFCASDGAGPSDKVIVLDRDGTLVVDRGYLGDPEGLEFTPHAAEALQWWSHHGYRLIVITNQSGVGRGLFPLEKLDEMNTRLHAMVENLGVHLERIYYCPHRPDAGCSCRKPAPGLLRKAASELGFRPQRAVVVGDKLSDIEFGRSEGARTILVASHLRSADRTRADRVSRNLLDAARSVTSAGW
jgi:D-glycero-D-manno-heptose 1,7-bisphosphate phosphatase